MRRLHTPEEKQASRIRSYKRWYGANWEKMMAIREDEKKTGIKPITRTGIACQQRFRSQVLKKGQFLRLIALKMQDKDTKPASFLALAKLYAELANFDKKSKHPFANTAPGDENQLIQRLEEEMKNGTRQ